MVCFRAKYWIPVSGMFQGKILDTSQWYVSGQNIGYQSVVCFRAKYWTPVSGMFHHQLKSDVLDEGWVGGITKTSYDVPLQVNRYTSGPVSRFLTI